MFAELHCKSHYSFLTGACSPQELVYQAAKLNYSAIAITDECSYAGIVKAYLGSKECGIKLIIGSEFVIPTDSDSAPVKLVLLARNRMAYQEISALISKSRRRSPKGEYSLNLSDLQFGLQHCLAIWFPSFSQLPEQDASIGKTLRRYFKQRLWIGVELFWQSTDQARYLHCETLGQALGINLVACNDVHMHCKSRKPLQDTLTAIRLNTTIDALKDKRQINAERYLRPNTLLKRQYPIGLLQESQRIADLCQFDMSELRYQYPKELVPKDQTPSAYLRRISFAGARKRWPNGVPKKIVKQLQYELKIIRQLSYEYYFLTVYDIVKYAQSQRILCQGRGSAANSTVCYCLYITEVDPNQHQLLFERFISAERNEPPDIDVDFESQRREEVIQYIYNKYSRKRTALVATVICYRRKSAIRDVGKALGFSLNLIELLNKSMAWWDKLDTLEQHIQDHNLDSKGNIGRYFYTLVHQIMGTPRHLSQHVGGFLITHVPTSNLVPIENAAMPDRTVIQWDKDDIEILGLLKVDILALGMLSAIQKALAMIHQYEPSIKSIDDIPKEDPAVYDLLCAGDSIGVFQVESRAQMSMLPRLKPRQFYDLVIEVAIVRPGPIQGGMVHPYLKRRDGLEAVEYANDEIKEILKRTLGIPVFQEQVIKLTMVAGGFTGGEADKLRRAMASWGKRGDLEQFREKLVSGMLKKGYEAEFAERLFNQIKGFGSYGFPESHSASFAILVYFSAWLKRYHPVAFYAGLLNSQPMGFYSPSQLVQDARRHHITVLPICINKSNWDHELEWINSQAALRLGWRLVKGISEGSALKALSSRANNAFKNLSDVKNRQLFKEYELEKMVNANAFHQFEKNRRCAFWQALDLDDLNHTEANTPTDFIQQMSPVETLSSDYQYTQGVSLNYHPMQILRNTYPFNRCTTANNLLNKRNNGLIEISGVVTGRQRPGTASGVIFMTLEDETGNINVVLWKNIQDRFRQEILNSRLLYIKGTIEHEKGVANVIAGYIEQYDHALPQFSVHSRNFH